MYVCEVRGDTVEALRYKPYDRGFDSRWGQWDSSITYPSGGSMALWSTQPVAEMSTRGICWVKAACE